MKTNARRLLQQCLSLLSLLTGGTLLASEPVAPPVGYVQISIPPQSSAICSLPFKQMSGLSSLDDLLAGQLTASTNLSDADRFLLWGADSRYLTAAKLTLPGDVAGGKWYLMRTDAAGVETIAGPVGNDVRIAPGYGFALCNRQPFEQIIRMGGELILQGVQSVQVPAGLGALAYPFTSAKPAGETRLSEAGKVLATNAFRMGEGYWVESASAGEWLENSPYGNPFSTSATVRIENLLLTGNNATLAIHVEPGIGAVSVYTRDLAVTEIVTGWNSGWKLAAANVDTAGESDVSWTDDLSASSSSLKGVRLYLVTRAGSTLDLSGNGAAGERASVGLANRTAAGTPLAANVADAGSAINANAAADTSQGQGAPGDLPPNANAPVNRGAIVFVDIVRGDDSRPGRSFVVTASDGPKKTIAAGQAALASGGTMIIRDGIYSEDLNISGKPISVRVQGKVTLRNTSVQK